MSMSVCAHRRDPEREQAGMFTGCLPCRCAAEYREELDAAQDTAQTTTGATPDPAAPTPSPTTETQETS